MVYQSIDTQCRNVCYTSPALVWSHSILQERVVYLGISCSANTIGYQPLNSFESYRPFHPKKRIGKPPARDLSDLLIPRKLHDSVIEIAVEG